MILPILMLSDANKFKKLIPDKENKHEARI